MSAKISQPAVYAGGIALALVFQVGLTVVGSSPVSAAPTPTRVADASSAQTQPAVAIETNLETNDDPANCSRARRRLWIDGEGWIVRRITTCR